MSEIMLDKVSGLFGDLMQKLAGLNGGRWLEDLKKFLRREEYRGSFPSSVSKIWETIKLGNGLQTVEDFNKIFNLIGRDIPGSVLSIFKSFTVTVSDLKEVDLVLVSKEDLGFKEPVEVKAFFEKALGRGLEYCSPEVILQTFLQANNQPKGVTGFAFDSSSKDSTGLPVIYRSGKIYSLGYYPVFWDEYLQVDYMIFVRSHRK